MTTSGQEKLAETLESNAASLPCQYTVQLYPDLFSQNLNVPSPLVSLPPPSARLETTAQLAYCNSLFRNHPSSPLDSMRAAALDSVQQASVDAILQDEDKRAQIRWLVTRVVEEFAVDSLKTSDKVAEVVLLGPSLGQGAYRKLLDSFHHRVQDNKSVVHQFASGARPTCPMRSARLSPPGRPCPYPHCPSSSSTGDPSAIDQAPLLSDLGALLPPGCYGRGQGPRDEPCR